MRNLGGYAGPGLTVIANKRSGGVVKTVLQFNSTQHRTSLTRNFNITNRQLLLTLVKSGPTTVTALFSSDSPFLSTRSFAGAAEMKQRQCQTASMYKTTSHPTQFSFEGQTQITRNFPSYFRASIGFPQIQLQQDSLTYDKV